MNTQQTANQYDKKKINTYLILSASDNDSCKKKGGDYVKDENKCI